jgi:hypothetical protein
MIYLLTAIGLSPGDSTHLHTTIHRTTQITTEKHPHIKTHTLNKMKHTITIAFQLAGNKPYNTGIRLEEEKGRGEIHPRTEHEVPEAKYMYSSTLSLISALDRDG